MGIIKYIQNKKLQNKKLFKDEEIEQKPAEIRLIYVKMKNYKSSIMEDTEYLDKQYYISSCFKAPEGMNVGEACKILSYTTQNIIKENKKRTIENGIDCITDSLVKNYGFIETHPEQYHGFFTITQGKDNWTTMQATICSPIDSVTDLFMVAGNKLIFSRSPLSKRYFEWYNPNITKEDVEKIYQKIGLPLEQIPNPEDLPKETYDPNETII